MKSAFKKIKQGLDERSNEHVVVEYRVIRGDVTVKTRNEKKDAGKLRRASQVGVGKLIRAINNQANPKV